MQLSWGRKHGWAGGECHRSLQICTCWVGWEPRSGSRRSFCVHRLCTPTLGSNIQIYSSVRSRCPLESFTWWPCCQSSGEMCGFHYLFEEPFIPVFIIESVGLCWWVLVLTLPLSFLKREHLFIFYNQTSSITPGIMDCKLLPFPIYNFLHAAMQISSISEAPGLQNSLIINYINQ